MEAFAEGVRLVKHCNQKLDEAENRVQMLVKKASKGRPLRPSIHRLQTKQIEVYERRLSSQALKHRVVTHVRNMVQTRAERSWRAC